MVLYLVAFFFVFLRGGGGEDSLIGTNSISYFSRFNITVGEKKFQIVSMALKKIRDIYVRKKGNMSHTRVRSPEK